MNKTKKIAYLGLGIALYVVLSMTAKIPLIAHIQTDLGYIAFAVYLCMFGWQAAIVGVVGCMVESVIINGWIPIGWMVGQAVIGVACGITFKKTESVFIRIIITVVSVFVGIGIVKTVIECNLYGIPFDIKFARNCIATFADSIAMIVGIFVAKHLVRSGAIRQRGNV